MTEQLGRYRLEEVIGVGSFATVHRAVDEVLDDTVVVKILAENHSLNPEIRERFLTEGRTLRRVDSPGVVSIHDIGESDRQQPYLVLQYADRGTLAERLRRLWDSGWRARPEDLLALARPLAEAVSAVHRAQLVHRDLSPGNLLLTTDASALDSTTEHPSREHQPAEHQWPAHQRPGDSIDPDDRAPGSTAYDDAPAPQTGTLGEPRLIRRGERLLLADLGMCKDLAMNSGLTVSGGTAGFRPPEQSAPGLVDTRADIWAMSAVLRWAGRDAEVPEAFHTAIARGMHPDPGQRQPDAATWLQEIDHALSPPPPRTAAPPTPGASTPAHTASPGAAGPSPQRGGAAAGSVPGGGAHNPPRPRSRALRVVVLAGVVVLALSVGLVAGLFVPDQGSPPEQADGASVSIDGPEELTVGEEAVFTAETEDVESWVWVLPTGDYIATDPDVTLTPSAPGQAQITLRGQAPDGTELETTHTFRVTE
ncbi:serine/threonine-protein kinase [Nesterenkonia alba]|uniref:serine/threonine-protein kinase n=1 Tax=Nesterenkonia alba TaxID=515814 RepID=UPI0003B38CEA|nr:serine/threonine-protein kinase [Nesterenkonia alba]